MGETGSITEIMENCAADAVRTAQENFGFALDFSEESIQSLETILACLAGTLKTDGTERIGEGEDAVEHAVKMWGGYLGEVVRRNCGGEWELAEYPRQAHADQPTTVPTVVVAGSQLYPLIKVYRRLTMGEPENVWKFYERIRTKISSVHPMDGLAN